MIVYKIICEPSGKMYIGCTKLSIQTRFERHLLLARLGQKVMPLYDAMRTYGADAFTIECLYEADSAVEMYAVEKGLITMHGTKLPRGYNLADGGRGGARPRSEESKRRQAEKMRARWADPEYKERVGKLMLDGRNAPGVHEKMCAAIKAARSTPESRAKTSTALKEQWASKDFGGRNTFSEERISKYKASMRHYWESPAFRMNASAAGKKGSAKRWKATTT